MNASSAPALLIHGHYAVAVLAEVAAKTIREQIADWVPIMEMGFQGRQVLVVMEYSDMTDGRPVGERKQKVFACGNDGQVRAAYAALRYDVEHGDVVCLVDASRPATTTQIDALCDMTLANAMPISYLQDIEVRLDFIVRHLPALDDALRDRLDAYIGAGIAPPRAVMVATQEADLWPISLSILPAERLYAMSELYGAEMASVLSVSGAAPGRHGLDLIVTAYSHWYRQFLRAA